VCAGAGVGGRLEVGVGLAWDGYRWYGGRAEVVHILLRVGWQEGVEGALLHIQESRIC
jgi:hypothetical protein